MSEARRTPLLVVLALVVVCSASGSDYVREGSVGEPPSKEIICSDADFAFLPVPCWVGERVVFLPARRDLQQYGYQLIHRVGRSDLEHPSYQELVGRIATITEIEDQDYKWRVRLRTEQGVEYDGEAFDLEGKGEDASLLGIAFLRDIDTARHLYLGKTLWLFHGSLSTYDAPTEEYDQFWVGRFAAVDVVDVVVGRDSTDPVRFILRDQQGREGLLDVNLSGTNVPKKLRRHSSFDAELLTYDPRAKYSWPVRTWDAVKAGRVFLGMSEEQARLSWGEPSNIRVAGVLGALQERWVYELKHDLHFEDGVVVAIRD